MKISSDAKKIGLCLLLSFLQLGNAWKQEIEVPVKVQYALFLKILSFERNLKKKKGSSLKVGVVFQEKFRISSMIEKEIRELVGDGTAKNATQKRIEYTQINLDETSVQTILENQELDVLYIAPLRAVEVSSIRDIAQKQNLVTLTGVPDYVKDGIMVGIRLKAKRPNILINLESARASGANFSSRLLKSATIIKK